MKSKKKKYYYLLVSKKGPKTKRFVKAKICFKAKTQTGRSSVKFALAMVNLIVNTINK